MRFKKVYIEITNTCNLKCPFCIQNQRPAKVMSIAEFSHILEEIKPYTNYVYLHVMGEPLSHPQLPEFLAICAKMQIFVNITTNGTLLKKRIEDIKSLPIRQLNISLHSYAVHHQKEYIKNVVECAKQLSNTYISYRFWCLRQHDMNADDRLMLQEVGACYERDIHEEAIKPHMSIKLHDKTFISFDEVFTWPALQNPFVSHRGNCRGFMDMCAILSDGCVVPCCLDANGVMKYGNIFETSFSDILQQARTKQFCHHMRKQELIEPLCQHCSYRLRFQKE